MQKIKIGHPSKFRDRDNFFPQVLFPRDSRDFTPYFHFRCVARATFDKNLIHSADVCFLVMACVGYSRAQLKTLSNISCPNLVRMWHTMSVTYLQKVTVTIIDHVT